MTRAGSFELEAEAQAVDARRKTMTRYERDQIDRRAGKLMNVIGMATSLDGLIKAIAHGDPEAEAAWTDDALKGLADVLSDMKWNLKILTDKVAEPAPYESEYVTGRY